MRGLTYSNAMASAAVFIALGGSSYAAVKVTGEDVKNGSLSGKDVRTGSLGSGDIRNGSLRAADLRPDVLKAGPVGKGDKGDPGDGGRWLLIDENGDVAEQSGGFRVISRPGSNGQPATNPNVYVDAGGSLVGKGLTATIAIQNRIDRTGDMAPDPAFAGAAAVGRSTPPPSTASPPARTRTTRSSCGRSPTTPT